MWPAVETFQVWEKTGVGSVLLVGDDTSSMGASILNRKGVVPVVWTLMPDLPDLELARAVDCLFSRFGRVERIQDLKSQDRKYKRRATFEFRQEGNVIAIDPITPLDEFVASAPKSIVAPITSQPTAIAIKYGEVGGLGMK